MGSGLKEIIKSSLGRKMIRGMLSAAAGALAWKIVADLYDNIKDRVTYLDANAK